MAGRVVLEACRFMCVGVANTLVTLAAFHVLSVWLGAHYLLASLLGYCLGVANSFVLNSSWTFRDYRGGWQRFGPFILANALSLGANLAVLEALVAGADMPPFPAQLLAVGASFAVNFGICKRLVFRSASLDCGCR